MSKEKLFSSYRWHEPIKAVVVGHKESTKEEQLKNTKDFLKILVDRKQLTQEEADKRLKDFEKSLK